MVQQFIKALKVVGVDFIVAPYEADPQMVFLEKAGIVDAIICEDSDLFAFGGRHIVAKVKSNGNIIHFDRSTLSSTDYNFSKWGDTEWRHLSILMGCDYLKHIPGVRRITAYSKMRSLKDGFKVIRGLKQDPKFPVRTSYAEDFLLCDFLFKHQFIFDPRIGVIQHLNPLEAGATPDSLAALGALLSSDDALGVCQGRLHPVTKLQLVDIFPTANFSVGVHIPTPPSPPPPFPRVNRVAGNTLDSWFVPTSNTPLSSSASTSTSSSSTLTSREERD